MISEILKASTLFADAMDEVMKDVAKMKGEPVKKSSDAESELMKTLDADVEHIVSAIRSFNKENRERVEKQVIEMFERHEARIFAMDDLEFGVFLIRKLFSGVEGDDDDE